MNSRPKTQNDEAWETLFEKYDILNEIDIDGKFIISASQIREYREPRLMAKFDHRINLPYIFSDHDLVILPISRGDYVISNYKAYQPFEPLSDTIKKASLPAHIQSLDPHAISSEPVAINCALASGMLSDFLGEEVLHATVSGRMGTGQFVYGIHNSRTSAISNVQVNNSQIEIDAALEGINSLVLLEAKRDLSADFIIRQLYYPYRVWRNRISKEVRPVFLVYSNGIYNLYEYKFQDTNLYNSLFLIRHSRYSIEDTSIKMSDLMEIMSQISLFRTEPQISFPQADSFDRVINICELLASQELSKNEITEEYAFDIRQTYYYTDAARYLGLVEKQKGECKSVYALTDFGQRVMRLSFKQRQLSLCKRILEHKVFHEVFQHYRTGNIPSRNTIIQIMKESNLYRINSEKTYSRRSSTITSWIDWILRLIS